MTSQVTTTGINTIALKQRIDALQTAFNQYFPGQGYAIIPSTTNTTGVACTNFAAQIQDINDSLVDLGNNIDLRTATGTYLDSGVACLGIERQDATATKVYLLLTAETETIVPAATSITASIFTLANTDSITITNNSCAQATYTVPTSISSGLTYSVILDGQTISYVASGSDTSATIAAELASKINSDTAFFEAAQSSSSFTVNKTTQGVIDYTQTFLAEIGVNVSLTNYSSYGIFYNSETGAYDILSGTFNDASVPVSGVTCNQPDDGIDGENEESDQTLRIRAYTSIGVAGTNNIGAIQGAIQALDYVKQAVVYVNNMDTSKTVATDIILPANTIYAIVLGGDKSDIATAIYKKIADSPVNIYGSISVAMQSQYLRNAVYINFDYAAELPITLTYVITVSSTQWYNLSSTAVSSIQQAAFDYIYYLLIGASMYMEQLESIVGQYISAGLVSIQVSYTKKPSSTVYTDDLMVGGDEKVSCQLVDISVSVLITQTE